MGKRLPLFSGDEIVKKLGRVGWKVSRQKGSHVMMVKPDYQYTLSIPRHKELGPGLLRKLLRQAGLTPEEFLKL
ncbi:periplasmic or secreted lipoprotein [Candidatus Nitromaritima sp. SCGC AAA799-C22]|nr:periplasmic or secreted lipoprotein [Candidatus Nitromaritima sp. SCGC AAA799-C22]